jgi:hypothetical protein
MFAKKMQSGQVIINFLPIELQQKSSSILMKDVNNYNNKNYICKQRKVVKQQLICYGFSS